MPQPYLGPFTPSRSRRTQSSRTSELTSTVTILPLSLNVCLGIGPPQQVKLSPLLGDCGTGGTNGLGVKASGSLWLIGKVVGMVPVGPAVRAGDRGAAGRDTGLAGAPRLATVGGHHDDLHLQRGV